MLERSEFEALLLAVKGGDAKSLERLVKEYEPELRLIARKRLGKELRPFLDSVDLVQSVHRSLLIGLRDERFDISTQENLLALATTIVQRKIAKHWRKNQRQKQFGSTDPFSPAELLLQMQSNEENGADQVQVREVIEQTLAGLDPIDQSLVGLRLQGYSTAQVAETLGLESDYLRVRLSRLRKRLRDSGLFNDWL